ncbi:TolC family outer membrane protein [Azomonas macrocytogenes]|uniref:Outer membrane protein n=1 Tax=Azomonas macrocytogenes TaxID=69962 RepID=A0A839SZ96_AZOMA|nr:TolC family outer membrane protein [Azomonas macrocytogenes]MBB3102472.1 outer membrane protein [Azomonas macrocytogenes]
MVRTTIISFGLFCSLLATPVHAARSEPHTRSVSASSYTSDLVQLYRESRLEDPRVLAAYARAQAGKDYEREALGALLPQVNANSSRNRITRDTKISRDSYDTELYSLSLTQHLYNKPVWEKYQKSKSLALQAESEGEDAQAEAAVDLAERYFVALAADDELELVMAERRTTQKNLDRINALYTRKMAMVTDVLELKARVDMLAASEIEARNQVRIAREALSEIVGRSVTEKLSRVREDVALMAPSEALDSWLDKALVANPALAARKDALDAAEAAVREGWGGHYPSLSLNLSAQRTDQGFQNTQSAKADSYVANLGVQVPIYSGGSTSARVRALNNERFAAEQDLEMLRRQVIRETTSSYLTAQSGAEKIRASFKALESAKQSSVASQKGFQYGVVNAVDVLTSVQKEFEARRDLLKAQYDFVNNLLVLNRWAGSLSEESIESVNIWLVR